MRKKKNASLSTRIGWERREDRILTKQIRENIIIDTRINHHIMQTREMTLWEKIEQGVDKKGIKMKVLHKTE